MTPFPALTFGFMLGMRHATDADHVAAVSTLVAGGPSARRAALVGAWWGAGHSLSVMLVGGALVLLRLPMPSRVALARMLRMERAVRMTAGVASVAIGLALAHRVGVRDGLFAAITTWTPE